MKESKAVYVTKRDINVELNREYQFYANTIERDREVTPNSLRYDQKTQEVGCQYNFKRENLICTCKNLATIRKRQEVRYFGLPKQIYAYHGLKSFTDIGVGSVKTFSRKNVKRIYLPETEDRGAGSSGLSSYLLRRTWQYRGNSYFENKRTSSKCVGGILEYNTGCVMNEKLSPIVHTVSGSTSPRESTLNRNIEIGSNTVVKSLKNITTQVEHIVKKEIENNTDVKVEIIQMKPEMKTVTVDTNKITERNNKVLEKDYSSDSLVQHIHNLEKNPSDDKESHLSEDIEDQMENKLEREYRRIFAAKPKSKESKPTNVRPMSDFKSTSTLKRRFEALRRGLARKEDSKRNAVIVTKVSSPISSPSRKDVSINSSPPSLEGRSYSNTKPYSPFQQIDTPVPSNYKQSVTEKKERGSAHWSSRAYDEDSECQGVKGMFKLWGKKFNFDEEHDKKRFTPKPSYASSRKTADKKIEQPKLVIKPEGEEKKEGRKFFFFKKKNRDSKAKVYKPKKDVTAGRCEVKDGLMIKIGGGANAHVPERIVKQPDKMLEHYNDMAKNTWLKEFLSRAIESRNSVQVRWNNKTYAPSSSTVFELLDNVYKDTGIVIKSRSQVTVRSSFRPYTKQHVNFVHQNIEAWMIPKTLTDIPKLFPVKMKCKSDEEQKDNIAVRISDQKWFIDKSKAFSHKIEVVLHSKNFRKVNKEESSEYLRIDIPKGFFVDSSNDDINNKQPNNQSSDEKVFKIVEYETESDLKNEKVIRNFDLGDRKQNNIKVTVNVKESEERDSKTLDSMIKRSSKYRDVIIQGSNVFVPQRCDVIGVGIITQRDLRVIRKPILKIQNDFSEDDSEHNALRPNHKKCEFAESYLQEYCRHWTPLGIDLYSGCISDSHLKCCSEPSRASFNIQGNATKSCSNIFDDFQTSTIVSSCGASSCSQCHTHDDFDALNGKCTWLWKFKKKPKEPINKLINTGIPPKDSIEVSRRRKIYAASMKSRWTAPCPSFDKPSPSVPSVEIKLSAGQDTLLDCPKTMKSCCKTLETPKKRMCKKHVSLPDCETMNDMLAKQLATPEGILAFKGQSSCDACKRKGSCPKHAKINPIPSCEIPRAPCRDACEVMKKAPCESSKSSCENPPLFSPEPVPRSPLSCGKPACPSPAKCKPPTGPSTPVLCVKSPPQGLKSPPQGPTFPPDFPSCPSSPPSCFTSPPASPPLPPCSPPSPSSPSKCTPPPCPPSPPPCKKPCPPFPPPCRKPPPCPPSPPPCPPSLPACPPSPPPCRLSPPTSPPCSPPSKKKPPPCPHPPPCRKPCTPHSPPCKKPAPCTPSPLPGKKPPPCPPTPPPSKKTLLLPVSKKPPPHFPSAPSSKKPPGCPHSPPTCSHIPPCPPSPLPCPHTLPCPPSPPPCPHTPPCPPSPPTCPHHPPPRSPKPPSRPMPCFHSSKPCPTAKPCCSFDPKDCSALGPPCTKPSFGKKLLDNKTPICPNPAHKQPTPCKGCIACQPAPCPIHPSTNTSSTQSPCKKFSLTSCSFGSVHRTPDAPFFYSPIHPCPQENQLENSKPCAFSPCCKIQPKNETAPCSECQLSNDFPWPTNNQVSNQSSVTSLCEIKAAEPIYGKCQPGCSMIPKLSCETIASPNKECKASCPNRLGASRPPCLPEMSCPPLPRPSPPAQHTIISTPTDTAKSHSKSKMSGLFLKKEPGIVKKETGSSKKKKTCSKDCLAWDSRKIDDCVNSKEKITIRVKNNTPSTEKITEGLNIKVKDEDGMTLFERKDYRLQHAGCSIQKPSLLGDMYNTSEVRRVATNNSVQAIGADKDCGKEVLEGTSDASIANLIEIQFKLKVTQGEKTTEINIANNGDKENEVDKKFEKKELMNKTLQEVFVVKDGKERSVDSPDQKNDINIRIVIKNFKSKSGKKKSANLKHEDYNKDYSQKISDKFHTVSTGYSEELNGDNVFSIHRTTVDLTSSVDKSMVHSNKSEEMMSELMGTSEPSVCRCALTQNISQHKIGDAELKSVPSLKYSDNKEIQEKKEETEETDTEKLTDHKYEYTEETDTDKQVDNKYDTEETDTEKQVEPKYDTDETDPEKPAERKYDAFISTDTDEREAIPEQDTFNEKPKSIEVIVKPHTKGEKKEMLKQVLEKVHETKPKNKTRMRKLRDMLKVILTSDSSDHDDAKLAKTDGTKDVTYVSLKPKYFEDSDSMNNYYMPESHQTISEGEINKQVLYPTGENNSVCSNSNPSDLLSSENEYSNAACMCSTVAARLKLAARIGEGGGCCCSVKPNIKINEEITCDLKKESDLELDYIPPEFVDVETQNSKYWASKITSTNLSQHRSMSSSIFECIDKEQEINASSGVINVDKTIFNPITSFSPHINHVRECEMSKLNRNTILSISDQDKIVLLSSKPTRVSAENTKSREYKKMFTDPVTFSHSSDILQSYETKKAVLEIYTEKTFSDSGERLVAKLPKFVYSRENEIQTNYEAMVNNTYKTVCKRNIVMMAINR